MIFAVGIKIFGTGPFMKTIVVKASQPTADRIWQYSVLDSACIGMVIKGTWIFPVSLPQELLQSSLSELLNYYPMLAGRALKSVGIECSNAGVPFTVCREGGLTRAEAVAVKDVVDRFSSPLHLKAFRRGEAAPLSVRLTHLKDGSVLSVHCSHACMDGSAFYTMMDNWARLCRREPIASPVIMSPVFLPEKDISKESVVERAKRAGWHKVGYKELWQAAVQALPGRGKYRPVYLHFSGEFIQALVESFNARHGVRYGKHAILSALITKLSLHAGGIEGGRICSQISVADMRGRVPGIPRSVVGNAVFNIAAEPIFPDDSLFSTAEKIDAKLACLFSGDGREAEEFMKLYIDSIGYKIPYVPFDLAGMNGRRPTAVYINDFLKFDLYSLDFGGGRPEAVLPHDLPDQVRIWPSGTAAAGADVYFTGCLAKLIRKMSDPCGVLNSFLPDYAVRMK